MPVLCGIRLLAEQLFGTDLDMEVDNSGTREPSPVSVPGISVTQNTTATLARHQEWRGQASLVALCWPWASSGCWCYYRTDLMSSDALNTIDKLCSAPVQQV